MKLVSLFSGAGGLDLAFKKAGFDIVWANDVDQNACETYTANIGDHINCGDIKQYTDELFKLHSDVDIVIGGPPCQGFSVAGKMNPNDPRSEHIWNFHNVVKNLKPRVFVMENVKALGTLEKWAPVRRELLNRFKEIGYSTNFVVLNASEFNVPQARERVFFIGFRGDPKMVPDLTTMLSEFKKPGPTVRQALSVLDRAGFGNNQNVCAAKITLAKNPILRKSPYAGMLFNGLGRPTRVNGYSATLPASMGGNKTPIIDEKELYEDGSSWVEAYHAKIISGNRPISNLAPSNLRRLTVEEAAVLQTFPVGFEFKGSQSSIYRQIGNAVPCNLGFAVASMIKKYAFSNNTEGMIYKNDYQINMISELRYQKRKSNCVVV